MKKKLSPRVQSLVETAQANRTRCLFAMVGDRSRYQVVNFHYMLSKDRPGTKPKVLWCYKNDLEFSSHQKKRMKEVKALQTKGLYSEAVDDPFELFISSADIQYTYYKESHKVLGTTCSMLILQDFEALTPNILCRTIETVEGGGIILILLKTMSSLKQLYTITMDVHNRYRTEANPDVEPRFNERFILSLSKLSACVVMDDELNILPISETPNSVVADALRKDRSQFEHELAELKKTLSEKELIGSLINYSKTLDQAKCIMSLVDVLTNKDSKCTVSITAGRGRGKSAALGLAIASAIRLGYAAIFVTAPNPQNVATLFEFIVKGLGLLGFMERTDFTKIYSAQNRALIIRLQIKKQHTQFVQFVFPNDAKHIQYSDLVVVDEAAAIPLPYVKTFLGNRHLFLSSTINGYEGTGRSLSLKLIEELRQKQISNQLAHKFRQLTLTDPIRYAIADPVEAWLNELLLLNATEPTTLKPGERLPHPSECELYLVNRDTLFSFKPTSEKFLFALMSLFVSSHYKNSPNDLQLLSDAASHMVFVLLGPLRKVGESKAEMPDILCAVQVALEGNLSKTVINQNSQRGIRPSGDLIPWAIREQFQDNDFPQLAGARVVRVAAHSKVVKMGYGSRSLELLANFFEGKLVSHQQGVQVQQFNFKGQGVKKPLLRRLEEIRPPRLSYLGTSFGFTELLMKFWRKNGYQPVYLRQTVNDITAEYSGIMLKPLVNEQPRVKLESYQTDFVRRFGVLLGYQFRKIGVPLALQILSETKRIALPTDSQPLSKNELLTHMTLSDFTRLQSYARNQVDYHLIIDLVPTLARLYFQRKLPVLLGYFNMALLAGIGLQLKTIDQVCNELTGLDSKNALPILQKTIIKFSKLCSQIVEDTYALEAAPQIEAAPNQTAKTGMFGKAITDRILTNFQLEDDGLIGQLGQSGIVTVQRDFQAARRLMEPKKRVKKH